MCDHINDIKERVKKLQKLAGFNYCSCILSLSKKATEKEWVEAWNNDQHIIMGMMNDMGLLCGSIDLSGENNGQ